MRDKEGGGGAYLLYRLVLVSVRLFSTPILIVLGAS